MRVLRSCLCDALPTDHDPFGMRAIVAYNIGCGSRRLRCRTDLWVGQMTCYKVRRGLCICHSARCAECDKNDGKDGTHIVLH